MLLTLIAFSDIREYALKKYIQKYSDIDRFLLKYQSQRMNKKYSSSGEYRLKHPCVNALVHVHVYGI